MVQINGKSYDMAGKSVEAMTKALLFRRDRIVVEVNGSIIPKEAWSSTLLGPNDRVEVVSFVGGG